MVCAWQEPERADASTQCAAAPTCVHAGTMTETTEHDKAAADKEAKAERQRRHQAAASQAELEALRLELAACQAATEQAVAAARAEVEADLQSQMEIREMVAREEVCALPSLPPNDPSWRQQLEHKQNRHTQKNALGHTRAFCVLPPPEGVDDKLCTPVLRNLKDVHD